MTSDDEPSTLPRRRLGRFLREAREGRGLSMDRTAPLLGIGKTKLQRLKTGQMQKPRLSDIRAMCELYEVSPRDASLALELAKQAQTASWYTAFAGLYGDATFNMYVELAAAARRLTAYHGIVLGLLQTEDYARAVISAFYRNSSPEDIDRRIELRLKRQTIVTCRADPVKLELLLHKLAMHRLVGNRRVMAAQLRHLAEAGKLPNVSLRIHPFASGCAQGVLHGPFIILDFGTDSSGRPAEPPLVYCEGNGKPDMYMEHADDVQRYHEIALRCEAHRWTRCRRATCYGR
ncbi:helix-turn-helix domain-containing protein [Nocardia goodfellowii]